MTNPNPLNLPFSGADGSISLVIVGDEPSPDCQVFLSGHPLAGDLVSVAQAGPQPAREVALTVHALRQPQGESESTTVSGTWSGTGKPIAACQDGPFSFTVTVTVTRTTQTPVVSSVSSSALAAAPSTQSFTVNGSGFVSGLKVSLTPPGGSVTVLSASQVTNVSSASFTVSAVLPVAGTYQLFVTNPDGGVSKTYSFQVSSAVIQTISHIADGAGWSTSIILVNTGNLAASFTLQFTGDNGTPFAPSLTGLGNLSTVTATIPVGGSTTISTDGTASQLSEGWARVTSSQSIGGTAIFRAAESGSIPYQEAAVPLLTAGNNSLLFPFDNNPGLATGVALAAPDNNTVTTVDWRQRNQAGQNLTASPETPQTVPAFGHTAFVLPVDSTDSSDLRGVAQFDSQSGPIFGLGIRANGGAFTSVEAVTTQPAATKIVSHIADGAGWKTTIILVNTDAVPAAVTVNLWHDDGTAQSTIAATIPVGGTYTIETPDTASGLTTGWAEILSGQSIGGTAIFNGLGQEAAVPLLTSGGMHLMVPFDVGAGLALGVALANTSTTQDAGISYTLRDESGNAIPNNPAVSITLPHHQHTSLVLPVNLNGAAELRGVVEFDSPNAAIFVLGIRGNNGAFTSIPALGN